MTVKELMDTVERLHPNQYSATDKLRWLNEIEQTVWREIVMTHDGYEGDMPHYDDVAADTVLTVENPYSRLYGLWMDAQIAYYDRESGAYEDAMTAFNAAYGEYMRYYNRTRMPKMDATHLHFTDRTWGVCR